MLSFQKLDGSAMECAAIVDGMWVLEVIEGEERKRALELLARVVAMLTKLVGQAP